MDLKNQPGELARLCEAMAGRGINLVLSAMARGEEGTVVFIADDEASAETVLQDADIQYTMRPALTIWLTSCRASRMTRPRSCRGWEPSGGPDAPPVLVNRRLPQQALDRIVARCDMTLYYGQGPGHAADGGGREGARGRCCRPGRCGKAQSDALLARHGFCALAGIAGRPGAPPAIRHRRAPPGH